MVIKLLVYVNVRGCYMKVRGWYVNVRGWYVNVHGWYVNVRGWYVNVRGWFMEAGRNMVVCVPWQVFQPAEPCRLVEGRPLRGFAS